jgi:hypothetical protein
VLQFIDLHMCHEEFGVTWKLLALQRILRPLVEHVGVENEGGHIGIVVGRPKSPQDSKLRLPSDPAGPLRAATQGVVAPANDEGIAMKASS